MFYQLENINTVSRAEMSIKDLQSVHWYALFTEIGRETTINDEWRKVRKHVDKLFDNVEVIWAPIIEDEIEDKIVTSYYLTSYCFIGMKECMSGDLYTSINDFPGVIKVLGLELNSKDKQIFPIPFEEMIHMFGLPIRQEKEVDEFNVGSPVKIVSGILKNHVGKIKEIRGKKAFIEAGILKNFTADIEIGLSSLELATY